MHIPELSQESIKLVPNETEDMTDLRFLGTQSYDPIPHSPHKSVFNQPLCSPKQGQQSCRRYSNHNYIARLLCTFNGWISHNEFKFWSQVVWESAVWGNSKATMLWNLWIWKNFLHWFGGVQTHSNGFSKIHTWLDLRPDLTFSSSWSPNFEPDIGQVQKSSGLNQGSKPDCGSTSCLWVIGGFQWVEYHHGLPMKILTKGCRRLQKGLRLCWTCQI